MNFETINEPVSVILLLEHNNTRPYRIKWRNQRYQVKSVSHVWREKVGSNHELHIACETTTATSMHLAIDLSDLSCRLVSTGVEN